MSSNNDDFWGGMFDFDGDGKTDIGEEFMAYMMLLIAFFYDLCIIRMARVIGTPRFIRQCNIMRIMSEMGKERDAIGR